MPENLIVQKYGEMAILEEMSHIAINDTYYQSIILENENKEGDERISPISNPKINVIKLGKGSDFEYVAEFAVMPKIELTDYKKTSKEGSEKAIQNELEEIQKTNKDAKEEDIFDVSDEEVMDIIENLRKARNVGAHVHEDGTVHTESHEEEVEMKEEDTLPELNDEFAQSFGENFKTLDDLKNKIKENISLEKKTKILDKKKKLYIRKVSTRIKNQYPTNIIG